MAHFRATCQGNRGPTSRLGSKHSGITATADGWDIGAEIDIYYDEHLGTDIIAIYSTRGSNGFGRSKMLEYYYDFNGKPVYKFVQPEFML